eukprot:569550-Rhodomonas_salina.1
MLHQYRTARRRGVGRDAPGSLSRAGYPHSQPVQRPAAPRQPPPPPGTSAHRVSVFAVVCTRSLTSRCTSLSARVQARNRHVIPARAGSGCACWAQPAFAPRRPSRTHPPPPPCPPAPPAAARGGSSTSSQSRVGGSGVSNSEKKTGENAELGSTNNA